MTRRDRREPPHPALPRYSIHITGEALSWPRLIPTKHLQPMIPTTLRAAAARVRLVLSLIDWHEALSVTADGLRILWGAARLLFTVLTLATAITWEHRAQIRAALVTAIAAAVVAAQLTIEAGRRTRHAVEAIGHRSAALLPQQPLAAVAPITATLTAAREALERLLRRLRPVAA